jgi:hypothetical protein
LLGICGFPSFFDLSLELCKLFCWAFVLLSGIAQALLSFLLHSQDYFLVGIGIRLFSGFLFSASWEYLGELRPLYLAPGAFWMMGIFFDRRVGRILWSPDFPV